MERRALPWMWSYVVFPFWIHQRKIDIAALVCFYENPHPRPPISLSLQSESVMVKPCCRPPSETPCFFFRLGQFLWLEHSFCLARYPVHTGLFTPVCWKNHSVPEALLLLLFPPGLRAAVVVFSFSFDVNDKQLHPCKRVGGVSQQLSCKSDRRINIKPCLINVPRNVHLITV